MGMPVVIGVGLVSAATVDIAAIGVGLAAALRGTLALLVLVHHREQAVGRLAAVQRAQRRHLRRVLARNRAAAPPRPAAGIALLVVTIGGR